MPFRYLDVSSPLVGASHSHVYVLLCCGGKCRKCIQLSSAYLNDIHSNTYGFLEHLLKRTYGRDGVLHHRDFRRTESTRRLKPHEVLRFTALGTVSCNDRSLAVSF